MDKEKQIEEMTRDLEKCCGEKSIKSCYGNCNNCTSRFMFNLGYHKINENEIVISKEEYESLAKLLIYDKPITSRIYEFINDMKERTRKETAREILDQIKFLVEERNSGNCDIEDLSVDGTILEEILNELAEKYGVDLGGTK